MAKEKQSVKAVEVRLFRDIQKLTSRQFVYEDGWCGMVPFDGKLTEMQTGPPVPFEELTWREQADVLRSFIQWDRYPERAWNDEYTIRDNIAAGKRPEQWLDGTSLRQSFQLLADGKTPPAPKQYPEISQQDLAGILDALGMTGEDRPPAAPEEGKLSLRDLQQGSTEQDKGEEELLNAATEYEDEEMLTGDKLTALFDELRADEAAAKREDAHGMEALRKLVDVKTNAPAAEKVKDIDIER